MVSIVSSLSRYTFASPETVSLCRFEALTRAGLFISKPRKVYDIYLGHLRLRCDPLCPVWKIEELGILLGLCAQHVMTPGIRPLCGVGVEHRKVVTTRLRAVWRSGRLRVANAIASLLTMGGKGGFYDRSRCRVPPRPHTYAKTRHPCTRVSMHSSGRILRNAWQWQHKAVGWAHGPRRPLW